MTARHRYPGHHAFYQLRAPGPIWKCLILFRMPSGQWMQRGVMLSGPRTPREARKKALWVLADDLGGESIISFVGVKRRKGWCVWDKSKRRGFYRGC